MNLNRILGEELYMKQIVVAFLVALTAGIVVFGLPSESQAQVTISGVTVSVAGGTPASFSIWSSQVLNTGQTLVLAQNAAQSSTAPVYNFDISDVTCPTLPKPPGCPAAVVSGTVNGVPFSFTDTSQALTLKNQDVEPNVVLNEAQRYTQLGSLTVNGLIITVSVGYADNLHTGACGAFATSIGLPGSSTCFPEIFGGGFGATQATFFQGTPQLAPAGFVQGNQPNHCNTTTATCWDSGAILFSASPAPVLEGRMTGGGSIFTVAGDIPGSGIRVTHGFELRCDATDDRQNLEINIHNPANDMFHLGDLTAATCIDDPNIVPNPPKAGFDTFIGVGKGSFNGVDGYTINFTFTDAGEPGTADTAKYLIWLDSNNNGIVDGGEVPVLMTGPQLLDDGNHQAHKN
jgi:hypothetical protein